MLLSVILFGSRARGDQRMRSDVDLLGITDTWVANPKPSRGATMFLYDFKYLLKKSKEGDLFLSHLVHEGQVLHDSARAFQQITEQFQYRESYLPEIRAATSVIKFIVSKTEETLDDTDSLAVRKRLVWSIRTILIARAAGEGIPVFSSSALAERSGIKGLDRVIDDRSVIDFQKLIDTAKLVADEFGSNFKNRFPVSRAEQIAVLSKMGGLAATTPSLFARRSSHGGSEYH